MMDPKSPVRSARRQSASPRKSTANVTAQPQPNPPPAAGPSPADARNEDGMEVDEAPQQGEMVEQVEEENGGSDTAIQEKATAVRTTEETRQPNEAEVKKESAPTPGPRAATFNNLLATTLSHTLQIVSYKNFSACFPTMAEKIPTQLKEAHSQMVGRLGELAKNEFDQILERRHVVKNLNDLEGLITDARRRKARAVNDDPVPTPPQLQPPSAILTAHLAPLLAQQQSQFNAKLQTIQSQNATLFETIKSQRKEIEDLIIGLETLIGDVETANGGLNKALSDENGSAGGLTGTTREVEMELSHLEG